MFENILVFIIISILVYTSKNKRAMGWLVFCYYAVYIMMELDYFGLTVGNIFTTHEDFIVWYLICTAVSFVFFMLCLLVYLYTETKTAIAYACWIVLNMFVSGLSAISQAFETNSTLIVYNVLQNLNLIVDIIVVILGTDTKIKGTQYVRRTTYSACSFTIRYINSFIKSSGEHK